MVNYKVFFKELKKYSPALRETTVLTAKDNTKDFLIVKALVHRRFGTDKKIKITKIELVPEK